jgi:tripartite-type tricarboxylate transporter receptor subunit TctC
MRKAILAVMTCLALATGLWSAGTLAQPAYPTKVVTLVIGFPAGSSTDVLGRVLAKKLGELAGQQFIVENKPGAGSSIAAAQVARASADGYTVVLGGIANAINAALYRNLPFDLEKDFKPVALVATIPNILVVHPTLGVNGVKELVALVKSRPSEISYGSSGNGTSPHLSGELFNLLAGVKMLHVPYKGSNQAVADLLAGRISVMFSPASSALPHMQSGKLKALAVTTAQRVSIASDLPTIAESGLPGYDTSIWFGVLAPAATPDEVVERLGSLVAQAQGAPDVRSQLATQGIEPMRGGPQEYAAFQKEEIRKWSEVVKSAGIKVD